MINNPLLRAPCGKYKSQRNKPFTEQTLRDHIGNCPQCNQNRVVFSSGDFIGGDVNPILDMMDTSDMGDGAFWALNAELNGDLDD